VKSKISILTGAHSARKSLLKISFFHICREQNKNEKFAAIDIGSVRKLHEMAVDLVYVGLIQLVTRGDGRFPCLDIFIASRIGVKRQDIDDQVKPSYY
jgi:hypothetical protein